MIVFIIAFVASFIPFIALYLWLRNHREAGEDYKKLCDRTLRSGVLCCFFVVLLSAALHILVNVTGMKTVNPLLYEAMYTFIVLAFSEELVKYMTFRRSLKKNEYPYSWVDVTVMMTIVGIGFGMIESVIYAIGASVPVVLIRGICVPHAGLGFIVGYFYGKGIKTGNALTKWMGLLLAWLNHGLYDYSLSEEFLAVNDNLVFVPLLLAVLDIVLVFLLIRFVIKAGKRPEYTEPLEL